MTSRGPEAVEFENFTKLVYLLGVGDASGLDDQHVEFPIPGQVGNLFEKIFSQGAASQPMNDWIVDDQIHEMTPGHTR